MKIKVWTILYGTADHPDLAIGSNSDPVDGFYVYATKQELLEEFGGGCLHISDSHANAVRDGNRFWIECVEVEI